MLKARIALLLGTAGLGACSSAGAAEPSSLNPLHCLVAFEVLSQGAAEQAKPEAARKFEERARWWAERLKALPKEARSAEATEKAIAQFLALEDRGIGLATECLKAQETERQR